MGGIPVKSKLAFSVCSSLRKAARVDMQKDKEETGISALGMDPWGRGSRKLCVPLHVPAMESHSF